MDLGPPAIRALFVPEPAVLVMRASREFLSSSRRRSRARSDYRQVVGDQIESGGVKEGEHVAVSEVDRLEMEPCLAKDQS